jgi:hypothetical protein
MNENMNINFNSCGGVPVCEEHTKDFVNAFSEMGKGWMNVLCMIFFFNISLFCLFVKCLFA